MVKVNFKMDLWLHVVGVLMLGLCALAQQQKDSRPPTVYLHIGPHHTGGKHIQNAIVDIQTRLGQQNVCWLGDKNPDFYHGLADAIEAQDKSKTQSYLDGIKNCLQSNRSVIVSSERFSNLTSWSFFDSVFASLPLHVIAFRREYISRLYAHYVHANHNTLSPMLLGEFLFKALASPEYYIDEANGRRALRWFFQKMRENALKLTVLDLDGCVAKGDDIAHAMFCGVLGVQCDVKHTGSAFAAREQQGHVLAESLLNLVHNFVKTLGCRICSSRKQTPEAYLRGMLISRYSNSSLESFVPRLRANLGAFVPVSEAESLAYRKEFGSVLLYSNHEAAMSVSKGFFVSEVDKRRFFLQPRAISWMHTEINRLYKQQKLCSCEVDIKAFVAAMHAT